MLSAPERRGLLPVTLLVSHFNSTRQGVTPSDPCVSEQRGAVTSGDQEVRSYGAEARLPRLLVQPEDPEPCGQLPHFPRQFRETHDGPPSALQVRTNPVSH